MIAILFQLAGLAMIGWALMILLPGWSVTRRLVEWTVFPVVVAVIYVVGVCVVLSTKTLAASATGFGIIADFATAEGVIRLLAQPHVALLAWIHLLAFDHLVGVMIYRDNLRHKVVPWPIQSLILFLTLMFGPFGFLVYWTVRVARGRGPGASAARVFVFGPDEHKETT